MVADLEANQKKQLDEFNKSTEESLNSLHTAASKEMTEFLFIANLHKNNKEMRQRIEELAEFNRARKLKESGQSPDSTSVEVGYSQDKVKLQGISIADLQVITSITGSEIKREGDSFTMQMGRRIFNPRYYLDPRQSVKYDMELMAQAVKASGHDKITMSVDFSDPKLAQQRGQEAYEACINTGYPPNKITIKVNGKETKAEDLFKDNPSVLSTLNSKAASITKELGDLGKSATKIEGANMKNVRADMAKFREQNKAPASNPEEPRPLSPPSA